MTRARDVAGITDLASAKGDIYAATADNTPAVLTVGTNGQALVANSGAATGLNWATPTDTTKIPLSTVTTAGDLILGTGSSTVSRLGIGTNGQLLQSNGTTATWATVTTSPVFPATATSSNINLASGNSYMVDTTSARTLTLPASASIGNEIHIFDATGSAATNNITVANNGLNINGQNTSLTIDKAYAAVNLVYVGATYGWRVS